MVPHRRILRAIALVALARGDYDVSEQLCQRFRARFPQGVVPFIEEDVLPAMSPEVRAYFATTDFTVGCDYRPFFAAARQLGITRFVTVGATGVDVQVSDTIQRWRTNDTTRIFIEVLLLCKAPVPQVAVDVRKCFGQSALEEDITTFAELFVDHDYVQTGWLDYMRCVGEAEAQFKRRLMEEPIDFVRWKLGVSVPLDSEQVLDRMISDAYYTERLIKHEAGDLGIHLEKDKLTRIKMERQTVMSGLAMRVKLRESGGGDAAAMNDIANTLRGVVLAYGSQELPSLDEIRAEENQIQTLDDLHDDNHDS